MHQLHYKFDKIHSKVDKSHRYFNNILIADSIFNSKEQQEIRNFIFRNNSPENSDEEIWKTDSSDSEDDLQENSDSQSPTVPIECSPATQVSTLVVQPACYLFYKNKHSLICLSQLFDQKNRIFFDVQKTWCVYWRLNSLSSLNQLDSITNNDKEALTTFILSFENPREGGFSGGTGYQSNIISSYAAVLSLALLGRTSMCTSIDRLKMLSFLTCMKTLICTEEVLAPRLPKKLKKSEFLGTFRLSQNGEFDIRNIYTALVIHSLMALGSKDSLFDGCTEFIIACQSYEGGIGPRPGHEAHGGFTYCGLAALALLGKLSSLNIPSLLRWLTNRQMFFEGGFSGRTNKIVDSCYSFWQGACFNILIEHKEQLGPKYKNLELIYSSEDLQKYLLMACQSPYGGMRDKPSKPVDAYHTMYSLIGLGLTVNLVKKVSCSNQLKEDWPEHSFAQIDPIFTIPKKSVSEFINFWKKK